MKAILPALILVLGFAASINSVQAQDVDTSAASLDEQSSRMPRGGWDGNNVRVAVTHPKLVGNAETAERKPGGGWDLNNLRVSVSHSKLVGSGETTERKPGGGWDLNNLKVSVSRSKLVTSADTTR